MCPVQNHAEVDEKLSHMRPVVVQETLNLARYVMHCKLKPEFDKASRPLSKIFWQNYLIPNSIDKFSHVSHFYINIVDTFVHALCFMKSRIFVFY